MIELGIGLCSQDAQKLLGVSQTNLRSSSQRLCHPPEPRGSGGLGSRQPFGKPRPGKGGDRAEPPSGFGGRTRRMSPLALRTGMLRWGSGFRFQGFGFKGWGFTISGLRGWGSRFGVWSAGFGICSLKFRDQGLGITFARRVRLATGGARSTRRESRRAGLDAWALGAGWARRMKPWSRFVMNAAKSSVCMRVTNLLSGFGLRI